MQSTGDDDTHPKRRDAINDGARLRMVPCVARAADGQPLYIHVARRAATEWSKRGDVSLVVGATYPAELAGVRAVVGDMPILVPGVGAQGGDPAEVVRSGAGPSGAGLIVNSSRAVLYADAADHMAGAASVARETRDALNAAR